MHAHSYESKLHHPQPPCLTCAAQNEYCLLSDMQKGFKVLLKLIELNNK